MKQREDDDQAVDSEVWESGWSAGPAVFGAGLLRWLAWGLLVSGPVIGVVAWASQAPSAPPPPKEPEKVSAQDASVGPAGFSERYVAAFLSAGGEDAREQLAAFSPSAARDLVQGGELPGVPVDLVTAVAVRQVSAGYWSVTVAAVVGAQSQASAAPEGGAPARWRYFQVAVHGGDAEGLVATALPAEVAGPEVGEVPELGYGQSLPALESDVAVQTLNAFFSAFLAGADGLERYVTPRASISPVRPAPYTAVRVREVAEVGTDNPFGEGGARDGLRRQLLVGVEASAGSGSGGWPMTYAVDLAARDGRWEVAAVATAPALKGD